MVNVKLALLEEEEIERGERADSLRSDAGGIIEVMRNIRRRIRDMQIAKEGYNHV